MRVKCRSLFLGAALIGGLAHAQEPTAAAEPVPAAQPALAPPPPAPAPGASPAAAPAAQTPAANAALQTPQQLAAQRGWSLAASLDHTMGHGTLVEPSQPPEKVVLPAGQFTVA